MEKLLTTKELASELQVTIQSIYNWKAKGMPFIKVGSQNRYILADVIEWLQKDVGEEWQNDNGCWDILLPRRR